MRTSTGQVSNRGLGGEVGGRTPTYETSLPGSPVDGQEIYYQSTAAFAGTDTMASTGAVWHLRYRAAANGASAGSGAWEFIGGSSLTHEITAGEGRSNTTYGDLTTVGPAVSLPLKGDYRVETYAVVYVTSNTSSQCDANMSYAIGATAAVDADSHGVGAWGGYNSTVQAVIYPSVRERVKTGLGAVTLTMKYKTGNTNGSGNWSNRRMTVTPIKVWS